MPKIINIDTSDNKKINIELNTDGAKIEASSESVILKSEAALPLIDKLLQQNKLKIEEIDEIKVKIDSGSYTGLRVGAALANALGFLLNIPINGKKIGELVRPVYNK